jgi:hypothetical protein
MTTTLVLTEPTSMPRWYFIGIFLKSMRSTKASTRVVKPASPVCSSIGRLRTGMSRSAPTRGRTARTTTRACS